jgi:four helix bundle protein
MKSHKDLDVRRSAVDLAEDVFAVSKTFPRDEQFGMSSQMRRASISIASNIAEGAGRQTQREFTQFLYIALGSASELETQIEIARRVELANASDCERLDALLARVAQMLRGLIRTVRPDSEN